MSQSDLEIVVDDPTAPEADSPAVAVIGRFGISEILLTMENNGLVGTITTMAILLLFRPVIGKTLERVAQLWRPAKV
jgi:hypothetical protein